MGSKPRPPPEFLLYGSHEYLVYEVGGHVEQLSTSIEVRLERHGAPKFFLDCTGSFNEGKLARINFPPIHHAESDEERMMLQLYAASSDMQEFVREWLGDCYRRYAKAAAR